MPDDDVIASLRFQRAGVGGRSMSSPLYAAVLDAVLDDVERGGPCAVVLDRVPDGVEPVTDNVALRFLGALHRIVLSGRAPDLARWYPSAGGRFEPGVDDPGPAVVAAVEASMEELVAGLDHGVQTNEVGRSAALAVGFTELLRRFRLPLRLLEIGASAGLNLRWDRFRYESGPTAWGDTDAPLRFGTPEVYRDPEPDVSAPLGPADAVASRAGCDRAPIDPSTDEGRLLLRSFVWPDQTERFARLDAALAVVADVRVAVDAADAGEWLEARLAEPVEGVTTVVFHTIVWQYLPEATQERVVAALESASLPGPLARLRMEPPPDPVERAELRVTTWDGGRREERLLARCGYHGRPVRGVVDA